MLHRRSGHTHTCARSLLPPLLLLLLALPAALALDRAPGHSLDWHRIAEDMRTRCSGEHRHDIHSHTFLQLNASVYDSSNRSSGSSNGSRRAAVAFPLPSPAIGAASAAAEDVWMEQCAAQCYREWAACTWAVLRPQARLGRCAAGQPCCLCEVRRLGGWEQQTVADTGPPPAARRCAARCLLA